MRNSPLENQKGLTLVETVVVLGVFAVIIAAVWVVVAVVYDNVRQYQATQQLQTTVQNVRQLYTRIAAFSSPAGTDMTTTFDSQEAFPKEMRLNPGSASGTLNHPWSSHASGTVKAYVVDSSTFGIRFNKMPKKACINLATKLSGGEVAGLNAVGFGTGGSITTTKSGNQLPLTVIGAGLVCTNSSNDNTVEWQFALRN